MNGTDAVTGKRLSGAAHLRQSVADILSTPIGTRVLNRDYGSELPRLVDNPQDNVTRVRIVAATAGALSKWEPRLLVTNVSVAFVVVGEFELTITGIDKSSGKTITINGIKINGNKSN